MQDLSTKTTVGVVGAGTMGAGIAQLAATSGHKTLVFDTNHKSLDALKPKLEKIFNRLIEKERMTAEAANSALDNISLHSSLEEFGASNFVIEAIVERLDVKQEVFTTLESVCADTAILASNTSSLPIAAIGGKLKRPEQFLGVHFFNPAPLMPLVEIVPGVRTSSEVTDASKRFIDSWGKTTVVAKDAPGFIVNRIARPFYGEALRIYEEGVADPATIDWAMRELGGFRMGPFQLMDFIGNDINYTVSETVFEAFYYDPRFKPSIVQRRMVEAGLLGKKSGRGYYDYAEGAAAPAPKEDQQLGEQVFQRILAMLINEAADAVFLNIATKEDIETAMTKGVNYPKGLLAWADELGLSFVLGKLEELQRFYGEDRYRPNPLLRRMAENGESFF